MDGMETALNPMKYRELSELGTLFDISIPTVEDPGHGATRANICLTAIVHYVPYRAGHRLGGRKAATAKASAAGENWRAMRPGIGSLW